MSKKLLIVILFLLISIVGNIYFVTNSPKVKSPSTDLGSLTNHYPYLSKRVLAEIPNDYLINFLELRKALRLQTEEYKNTFAFYFEYLPTGSSIGVHEKAEFPAASLLKVPVVMAYYHQKERLKQEGDSTVKIRSDQIDNTFGTLWKKGPGATVSLDEMARLAIIESDNTAARVLTDNIDIKDFEAIYEGLDIELKEGDAGVILTAKNYSSILKALFFSSVITREHSQHILEMMTRTIFNDKLPAGVPGDVKVAHKIGVLGENLFMDCGIVYPVRRQYMLCMISATDEDVARERMVRMSKTTYDFVSTK